VDKCQLLARVIEERSGALRTKTQATLWRDGAPPLRDVCDGVPPCRWSHAPRSPIERNASHRRFVQHVLSPVASGSNVPLCEWVHLSPGRCGGRHHCRECVVAFLEVIDEPDDHAPGRDPCVHWGWSVCFGPSTLWSTCTCRRASPEASERCACSRTRQPEDLAHDCQKTVFQMVACRFPARSEGFPRASCQWHIGYQKGRFLMRCPLVV
jgi:hypothetical protein